MIVPRLPHRLLMAIAGVLIIGIALSASSAFFCNMLTVRSIAIGVTLAAANLYVLGLALTAVLFSEFDPTLSEDERPSVVVKTMWGVIALAKIVVLFAAVALMLRRGIATPLPLVLGYLTLPFGIAIGSIACDRGPRHRRPSEHC